jgi:hypothetical protein
MRVTERIETFRIVFLRTLDILTVTSGRYRLPTNVDILASSSVSLPTSPPQRVLDLRDTISVYPQISQRP